MSQFTHYPPAGIPELRLSGSVCAEPFPELSQTLRAELSWSMTHNRDGLGVMRAVYRVFQQRLPEFIQSVPVVTGILRKHGVTFDEAVMVWLHEHLAVKGLSRQMCNALIRLRYPSLIEWIPTVSAYADSTEATLEQLDRELAAVADIEDTSDYRAAAVLAWLKESPLPIEERVALFIKWVNPSATVLQHVLVRRIGVWLPAQLWLFRNVDAQLTHQRNSWNRSVCTGCGVNYHHPPALIFFTGQNDPGLEFFCGECKVRIRKRKEELAIKRRRIV